MSRPAHARVLAAVCAGLAVLAMSCDAVSHTTQPTTTPLSPGVGSAPRSQPTTRHTTSTPQTASTGQSTSTSVPTATAAAVPEPKLVRRECDTDPSVGQTDCYWLEVPERRDRLGARTIRLWVAVVHRKDAAPGAIPFVFLTGGPGVASSTGLVDGHLFGPPTDVVVVDQRGTGRSEPRLDCPELVTARLDGTHPWSERLASLRAATATCRDRLSASGVDLDGYDTVENAADVVDLRRALGYTTWNIGAMSYGGRLAREVFRQDPTGVSSLTLDSTIPTAHFGPAALLATADDALARLSNACAAQPRCADANGDIAQNLATAAARLDHTPHPLPLSSTGQARTITGTDLYYGADQALHQTTLIPLLPAASTSLARGDDSLLDALAAQLDGPPPTDPRDDYATALDDIISCADEQAGFSAADRAAIENPGRWATLMANRPWPTCDAWHVSSIDRGGLAAVSGDIPVLAVFGSLDPDAPPTNREEIRTQFPASISLVYPGGGHGVLGIDDCASNIALAFVQAPAEPLDTSCVASMPQPFAG